MKVYIDVSVVSFDETMYEIIIIYKNIYSECYVCVFCKLAIKIGTSLFLISNYLFIYLYLYFLSLFLFGKHCLILSGTNLDKY